MLGMGGNLEDWTRWLAKDKAAAAGIPGVGPGGIPNPGGLPGAQPAGYTPAAGGIPGVTDPATSFANLLAGITGQLGNLGGVIGGITQASNKALRDQYSPGYFEGLDTVTSNTNRRAKGDISDLIPSLSQNAAEAAVNSGVPLSNAAKSKFTRDVLGSEYAVQEKALQDLEGIKNLTPTVAPFDASRLVPDIGMQVALQQLADMLRGAPQPEAAYQRNRNDALAGLGRGFNAGYNGGARPISSAGSSPVQNTLNKYGGTVSMMYPGNAFGQGGVQPPSTPGWGDAWNNEGGHAAVGNVPEDPMQFGFENWEPGDWWNDVGGNGGGGQGGQDDEWF